MFPYVLDKSQCLRRDPFPGVTMYAMEGQKMTVSIVEMEPHAVIDEHSHPHEQVGCMIAGEAEFIIDGRSQVVRAGQVWRLPGGVRHKVITGEQAMRAVDVFYPIREDMRPPRA